MHRNVDFSFHNASFQKSEECFNIYYLSIKKIIILHQHLEYDAFWEENVVLEIHMNPVIVMENVLLRARKL